MILTEFLVVLYADHVRFHPRHPYIESTDSLINSIHNMYQVFSMCATVSKFVDK